MRTIVPLLVCAACILAIWPGPLADGALGHPSGDMPYHIWGTWWFQDLVLRGQAPTWTSITHMPRGGALWHADPLGATLSLPLAWVPMPLRWNLLLTAQVLAAGLSGMLLGRSLAGARGGLVAGLICGCSPYAISLLHSGISEYLGLCWPVLFTWAAYRCLHESGRWWVAALLLFVCSLQAFYYGAFACLMLLCLVPGPGFRERIPKALRVLALGLLLTAPPLALALSTLHHPQAAFTPEQAPGWSYASLPATDLSSWLRWGRWYFPDTPAHNNPGILHVNALGWVSLGLALWGVKSSPIGRKLGLAAACYGVFALGPALAWNGQLLHIGGRLVPLPLALAYLAPGSPFGFVHHPYRMVAFLTPLLAALAALGLRALPRPAAPLLLGLILLENLRLSPAPWPVVVAPWQPEPIYQDLQGEGAVLDWPPDMSVGNRHYLMQQIEHGRPVATGVTVFLDERLREDPLVHTLLRCLDKPQDRARDRDIPPRGQVLLRPRPGPSALQELGFAWLVLHPQSLSAQELQRTQRALIRALGPADLEREGAQAWSLTP